MKLSGLPPVQERMPLSGRELKRRPAGVLGVTHQDMDPGRGGLDAVAVVRAMTGLPPRHPGTVPVVVSAVTGLPAPLHAARPLAFPSARNRAGGPRGLISLMLMIGRRDLPRTTTRTGPAVPKVAFGAAACGGTSYRDGGEHGGDDLFPHGLSLPGRGRPPATHRCP